MEEPASLKKPQVMTAISVCALVSIPQAYFVEFLFAALSAACSGSSPLHGSLCVSPNEPYLKGEIPAQQAMRFGSADLQSAGLPANS